MYSSKLSILIVSGSEICKEKYRKYFLFVLKHMVLKLTCVHFKKCYVLLLSINLFLFFHWGLGEDESILEAELLSLGCLPLDF